MRSTVLLLSLAASALAQTPQILGVDWGNGVHVPGQIPANLYEPLQHRLAYAGTTGMTVSWSTFIHLEQPQVAYGLKPDKLNMIANSTLSTTYPTSRTWNNHVKLQNLQPGTKYYYRVSYTNCAYCAYLPTYSFTTARAKGDPTPFTFAAFADLGLMGHDGLSTRMGPLANSSRPLGANETNTIQSLLQLKDTYEFLLHSGDIGYADYGVKEAVQGLFGTSIEATHPNVTVVTERYESLSEQFFDQMQPLTAEKPWMVTPGNHEASCDNGGYTLGNNSFTEKICMVGQTNFTFYIEHYKMPSYESGGRNNFWYSYDSGLVHFISLDTETDLGHGLAGPIENTTSSHNGPFGLMNEQINWLENDLKNVDRSLTPWVFVSLHRPWYTSVGPPSYPAWQQAFEQLFYDYNVDIYHQGHVHTYERFTPMFNGTIDPNGLHNPRAPWIIVNGAAGHFDGLDTFTTKYNGSAAGNDKDYGWGRVTVHNRTHMSFEYIASNNSTVVDEATLYKAHEF
ncbi:Metallo-dependent phosphatase [Meredithblackwellia eburnea MCA 4105]